MQEKMVLWDIKVAQGDCGCFWRCPEAPALPLLSMACFEAVAVHWKVTRELSGEVKARIRPELVKLSLDVPWKAGTDIPTHPFVPVFIFGPLGISPSQTSFLYGSLKQTPHCKEKSLKREYQFYISLLLSVL